MAFYLALYLLPFRQERWHSGPREPVDTQGGYLAHLDLASSLRACLRRPHSLALWTALGRQITNRLRAELWKVCECVRVGRRLQTIQSNLSSISRLCACIQGRERRFPQLHPSPKKTGDLQSSGSALNLLSKICMLIESGEEGKQSKVREMTANQSARKKRKRRRFFKLPLAHS